ncbi:MAG: adenylate kinase [Salinivirgaceae bacterium]|jgi:adenylate kinase|nr:adenylate kinase [Salinivirgaceae bacterium]
MFNIVIFGAPGSGKGTQSLKIAEKYQLKHLSTGDVLREEIKSGSELGKEIARLIDSGNFVPDEMIEQMVETFILANKDGNGIIFDGFPRTVKQAQWLKYLFEGTLNHKVNALICLDVPEAALTERILKRGRYSGRADDQDVEIIETRIQVYHKKTGPVIEFYAVQGKLENINGFGMQETVFDRICKVVDRKKKES